MLINAFKTINQSKFMTEIMKIRTKCSV